MSLLVQMVCIYSEISDIPNPHMGNSVFGPWRLQLICL